MRPPAALAIAVAVATSLSCAPDRALGPAAPAPSSGAATLVAGADSVVVDIELQGCFHHMRHRLALVPDGEGARVSLATTSPALFPIDRDPGVRYRAPAHVDGATLARLERMLAMYRAIPQDEGITCTSTIEFRIARWERGAVAREERIFDGTCDGMGRDEPSVLWTELVVYEAADGD